MVLVLVPYILTCCFGIFTYFVSDTIPSLRMRERGKKRRKTSEYVKLAILNLCLALLTFLLYGSVCFSSFHFTILRKKNVR